MLSGSTSIKILGEVPRRLRGLGMTAKGAASQGMNTKEPRTLNRYLGGAGGPSEQLRLRATISPAFRRAKRLQSFNGDAFREVARLINVATERDREMVCE